MTYQVLALKWRPNSFESLVGQSHVVQALTNALTQQRLHHAYLFTGTRGVGKTTLGRILAKCFNCEQGISATPCNTCRSCIEISEGRFIDLIEVDAASRTKVEDTRELLENVPYAPTSGRFKVYLIDEVHMLSTHSFNALLKTLEEPPPHVKFFLATTDPQKLPITVVSRCLQFHLKSLSQEQIEARIAHILTEENIAFEANAIGHLARAARGSMRDGLSLLDQAIAFSNSHLTNDHVKSMLSTIDASYLYEIIAALIEKNAHKLLALTQTIAEQSLDFGNVLEELLSLLHQIALNQFITEASSSWDFNKVAQFAQQICAEDVQLYYQIALIGRKDLPLAPTARTGFEMVLLRMLAFQPDFTVTESTSSAGVPHETPKKITPSEPVAANNWQAIVQQLNLTGISALIAENCVLEQMQAHEIILAIDPSQAVLLNKKQQDKLQEALSKYFNKSIALTIKPGQSNMATPAVQDKEDQMKRKSATQTAIQQDPNVQRLIEAFDAQLLPDSITTHTDSGSSEN